MTKCSRTDFEAVIAPELARIYGGSPQRFYPLPAAARVNAVRATQVGQWLLLAGILGALATLMAK
jgi:hypothetical protein